MGKDQLYQLPRGKQFIISQLVEQGLVAFGKVNHLAPLMISDTVALMTSAPAA
jgi:hypothetical protein